MLVLLFWLWSFFQIDVMPEAPVEIGEMPPDPFLEDPGIPKPDTPFTYTGEGPQPTWNDVYNGAIEHFRGTTFAKNLDPSDPTDNGILYGVESAIGESLKAASGFINRVSEVAVGQTNELANYTQNEVGLIVTRLDTQATALNKIVAEVNFLAEYVIPDLQAQIDQLRHDVPLYIEYAALSERNWTVENIFAPLYDELLKVQPAIQTAVQVETVHRESAITDLKTEIPALIAPVLAPVLTAVAALTKESDDCVKPMCSTMGPNTNLGKLLSGLALAADAAALADLLSLTAPQLAEKLSEAIAKMAGYVGDFEGYFTDGTETIGSVLGNIAGNLI